MTMLSFQVQRRYPDFTLDVGAEVSLDGITALFGASGSGKSTLLRILAGLEREATGVIRFDGETWLDTNERIMVPAHRRGVGYVFQDARLFPHLSVAGNLRYAERRSRGSPLRAASVAPGTIDTGQVVRVLDLEPLLGRRPTTLSGGEGQRVAIARALLTRPRLLLMDEPLAALDLPRRGEILAYIRQLPATFGVPIVYVTHAIDEVVELAERIIVLSGGHKLADGPTTQVLDTFDLQPALSQFEAGALLSARVLRHDTEYQLTHLDHRGIAIVIPRADLAIGSSIRLRIRSRDVALAIRHPQGISIRNVFPGTVADIATDPETAHAEVLVDIGGTRLRARVTRAALAELSITRGTEVFALVKSVSLDRHTQGTRSERD